MQHNQHIPELGVLFERYGIRHVIICPGSRNAPLIQLFTSSPAFSCYSVVDERSAGYVALGMARQLQAPVAVVTTSGTAVLNLSPAVAEAYHQQIPLIVLTADRPLEKISRFNNQVTEQRALFFNHSVGFYEFSTEVRREEDLLRALAACGKLVGEAINRRGPVHINMTLTEPLYESLPPSLMLPAERSGEDAPEQEEAASFGPVDPRSRIMVLAGTGVYDKRTGELLEELSKSLNLVVIAENLANLPSELFISCPELILAGAGEEEKAALAPDLVIAFGGQVVSKRLKLFLQEGRTPEVIEWEGDPLPLLLSLAGSVESEQESGDPRYPDAWKKIESRVTGRALSFLEKAPFSNLTVMHTVLSGIPAGTVVHLGNSAPVRYSQLLPARAGLRYFANRGTSGIDGVLSTAVGAAMVSDAGHLLVLGDLSFVYDSNALWNKAFPDNLNIVVINDGGGGIFRLLDGPGRMAFFEEFSVTHHPVSLELLSQSFGRNFLRARNMAELTRMMDGMFQSGPGGTILEADTTESENSLIFKQFFSLNQ